MVAVLAPTASFAPSSAPSPSALDGSGRAPVGDRGPRPALRVIEGGRAPRPARVGRPDAGVLLRRRLVAALALVLVLGAVVVGVRAAATLLAAPVTPTTALSSPSSATPIATDLYVVRPGDTLWSIAGRLDPDGDPRPLVDELRSRAGGAAIEAGQRIDVSGLGR